MKTFKRGITARGSIGAGDGIKAGGSIVADGSIVAGCDFGIYAGLRDVRKKRGKSRCVIA
ncbi:MAG: hypothetical protein RR475_03005 [Clostridia bacterium]